MSWALLRGLGETALGFASGIKLWLIAGGVVTIVVGGLWLWNARLRAELRLATVIAADNAKVVKLLKADAVLGNRLALELRAEKRALEERFNDDVRRIYAAGRSTACINSPAWRAFLDNGGAAGVSAAPGGVRPAR